MKRVIANVFNIPIKVLVNTGDANKADRWARIKCVRTGRVLHTGRIGYIKRVARTRYNVDASL